MKKIFLNLALSFLCLSVSAQWNDNGLSKTTGNLQVGNVTQKNQDALTMYSSDNAGTYSNIHFNFNNKLGSFIQSSTLDGTTTELNFFTTHQIGQYLPYKMTIKGNGNVGIGVNNPVAKLDVNGTIRATKFEMANGSFIGDWNKLGDNSTTGILSIGNFSNTDTGIKRSLTIQSSDKAGTYSDIHFNFNNKLSAFIESRTLDGSTSDMAFYLSHGIGQYSQKMVIKGDGKVGIGTLTPTSALDVNGTIRATKFEMANGSFIGDWNKLGDNSTTGILSIGNFSNTDTGIKRSLTIQSSDKAGTYSDIHFNFNNKLSAFIESRTLDGSTSDMAFYLSHGIGQYSQKMVIKGDGKVGIGTLTPTSALDVNGTIKSTGIITNGTIEAKEIKVQIATGADYVFDGDYKLRDLSEVESFVKTNKHLPEVQSEKDMQENGMNINEFQIKLLQKIEELTLYAIQQNKRIEQLEGLLNQNIK